MNINLQFLLDKFKTWKEAKVNKQPLSAESAYTLSAINKDTTLEVLYEDFKKNVLTKIKDEAKYRNVELYLEYPYFVIAEHKEQLIKELKSLGYKIPYISKRSIIISWGTE